MLGQRIRSVRIQQGLSQAQLAGKEVTRAFISLLENGHCGASPETLRLIAGRLGKPPDYFLQDPNDSTQITATVLMQSAQRSWEANNLEAARQEARQAVLQSQRTQSPDLEGEAQMLHGLVLKSTGSYQDAADCFELALECFHQKGNRAAVAHAHLERGNCFLLAEEFLAACRSYEKALKWADGMKSAHDTEIRARVYLGTTHLRLGHLDQAESLLRGGLSDCDQAAYPDLWADGAMGLGVVLHQLGRTEEAIRWSQRAETALKDNPRRRYEIRQNLAVFHAASSRWERAYILLKECLNAFKELGLITNQASALEELSHYWLHKGDLERARASVTEALDLLDVQDHGILRGRLYRLLAMLEKHDGNQERAAIYLRISAELFRRLKAAKELAQTLEDLRAIQTDAVPD